MLFAASALGQLFLRSVDDSIVLSLGLAALVVGTGLTAASLAFESLLLFLIGAIVVGAGGGSIFRAGLAAINAKTPSERPGEVDSSFYLAVYLGISLPVTGVGVAADTAGLKAAGIAFSVVEGAIALLAVARQARETVRHTSTVPAPGR